MRILFAGDEHHYSAFALKKVLGLARQTWADVTLLGIHASIQDGGSQTAARPPADHPLSTALSRYRKEFLESWDGSDSPYAMQTCAYRWFPLHKGLWEELQICTGTRKELKTRLRVGPVANSILAEAAEEGTDLIVLGCSGGGQCRWQDHLNVPERVTNDADCSVLLVKEDQPIRRILACIDQTPVSQASLEMINQMTTIHDARLELIGLAKQGGVETPAYKRLMEVSKYYQDCHIQVKTQVTEISDFENFIAREAKEDLLALWMGKKSLLKRFFPKDWVGRFVNSCQSSVLVLR